MEIKECERYARSRVNWLSRKFGDTIPKKYFFTTLQAKVQELYRDGLIILRRIQLLKKDNPIEQESLKELEYIYHKYRFESIPNFMEFLEILDRK